MKKTKKSGWLDGIEPPLGTEKKPLRESQAVAEHDAVLRQLTKRLKETGKPNDVKFARASSLAGNVAAQKAHEVAFIGERSKLSQKVEPEECRSAYERQRKANPKGSYTTLCDAVAAELGCAGRTIRRYVPNPSPRKKRRR